jgi:hypothetical protein
MLQVRTAQPKEVTEMKLTATISSTLIAAKLSVQQLKDEELDLRIPLNAIFA